MTCHAYLNSMGYLFLVSEKKEGFEKEKGVEGKASRSYQLIK